MSNNESPALIPTLGIPSRRFDLDGTPGPPSAAEIAARLTVPQALDAFNAASGSYKLAAEELGVTTEALIAVLSEGQATLAANLRTRAMLESFSVFRKLTSTVGSNADRLEPADAARALNQFTQTLEMLTRAQEKSGVNVNINGMILQQLPARERDIVQRLSSLTDADFDTIEGDYTAGAA